MGRACPKTTLNCYAYCQGAMVSCGKKELPFRVEKTEVRLILCMAIL